MVFRDTMAKYKKTRNLMDSRANLYLCLNSKSFISISAMKGKSIILIPAARGSGSMRRSFAIGLASKLARGRVVRKSRAFSIRNMGNSNITRFLITSLSA